MEKIYKRDIIYKVRKRLRSLNIDSSFKNKFIFQTIHENSKWIIKREAKAGKIYKNNSLLKALKCRKVVKTSITENGCPIQIDCPIYRTDKKLPEAWIDDNGPIISYVVSIDDSMRFDVISKGAWIRKQNSPYNKYDKTKYVVYSEGYLWFVNSHPKRVNIYGYWTDDSELEAECGEKSNDCIRYLDGEYNIPSWIEAEVIDKTFMQLFNSKKIPVDETPNKNEMR